MSSSHPARDRWRAHALDGALSWFHPRTGLNLRCDAPATRALRRTTPRVVLFGITNRCNLSCDFCSRDVDATSDWSVDSAATMLEGLARAGVLEVAFGGGELQGQVRPFVDAHVQIQARSAWHSMFASLETARPGELMTVLVDFGRVRNLDVWIEAEPREPLAESIARLATDLVRRRPPSR